MGRLPWTNRSVYRGAQEDDGMEHLETDVMRFLAILALCLVAIFALVQSMPLDAPTVSATAPATVASAPPAPPLAQLPAAISTPSPEHISAPPDKDTMSQAPAPDGVELTMPPRTSAARKSIAVPSPAVAIERPPEAVSAKPEPVTAALPPEPAAATPDRTAQPSEPIGFTLRFESADALQALVARDEVALYALARGKAWRAMWFSNYLGFRPAQAPDSYHEMAAQTVPDAAVRVLRQRVSVDLEALRWGVTLPPSTSAQLQSILARERGGDLVIDAQAQLRLETGT